MDPRLVPKLAPKRTKPSLPAAHPSDPGYNVSFQFACFELVFFMNRGNGTATVRRGASRMK
jgi:hypothetical protein